MVLFPIGALLAATAGMRNYLAELSARGTVTKTELPTFEEFTDLVGLPEIREQERRYAAGDQAG
jgi:2-methylisocitrate lyase-like PEP mutase family enzyme